MRANFDNFGTCMEHLIGCKVCCSIMVTKLSHMRSYLKLEHQEKLIQDTTSGGPKILYWGDNDICAIRKVYKKF